MNSPYVLGLTGGIASGKTTLSHWLALQGIEIIDADVIAKEIVVPGGPVLDQMVEYFGPEILNKDKSLNRKFLKNIIFKNNKNNKDKLWLENLMHPVIREKINQRIENTQSKIVCLVIPLLKSRGDYPMIQKLIVIDLEPEHQKARLIKRDGVSHEEAQAIIDSQPSREARLAMADLVIRNNDGLENFKKLVEGQFIAP